MKRGQQRLKAVRLTWSLLPIRYGRSQYKLTMLPIHKVDEIARKLDDLENFGHRLNLLFFGLNDTNLRESWETSEQIVRALCTDKLGIEIGTVQRAHRIGRHRPNKNRPVIVNFLNYKDTKGILGKCAALKGTPYSVSRDFSPRVRDIRRRLWAIGKERKRNSPTEKVSLAYDKLIINGDTYVWDDSSESVKKLAKQ